MQKHIFCEPFFIRVILLKMKQNKKNKKTDNVNVTTNKKKKHILKSFETNTNVLKPSVSLPRLL